MAKAWVAQEEGGRFGKAVDAGGEGIKKVGRAQLATAEPMGRGGCGCRRTVHGRGLTRDGALAAGIAVRESGNPHAFDGLRSRGSGGRARAERGKRGGGDCMWPPRPRASRGQSNLFPERSRCAPNRNQSISLALSSGVSGCTLPDTSQSDTGKQTRLLSHVIQAT